MKLIQKPEITQEDIFVPAGLTERFSSWWNKQPAPEPLRFAGRKELSRAVIEMDQPVGLEVKIEKLVFPECTLYGVIPMEDFGGLTYECIVDHME